MEEVLKTCQGIPTVYWGPYSGLAFSMTPERVIKLIYSANWGCPWIGMDVIVNLLWTKMKHIIIVIYLFQNMPSIPSPTIMQLDPNDENIILSIPEDTGPVVKESASTLTPKKV